MYHHRFEFEDTDQFLNLDSILVREKPAWCYMNPKLRQEGGSLEDTGNFLQVPIINLIQPLINIQTRECEEDV